MDNTRNDLSERDLSGEEAQDRVQWRRLMRSKHRPHIKVGKMRKKKKASLLKACRAAIPILIVEIYFSIMSTLAQ